MPKRYLLATAAHNLDCVLWNLLERSQTAGVAGAQQQQCGEGFGADDTAVARTATPARFTATSNAVTATSRLLPEGGKLRQINGLLTRKSHQ